MSLCLFDARTEGINLTLSLECANHFQLRGALEVGSRTSEKALQLWTDPAPAALDSLQVWKCGSGNTPETGPTAVTGSLKITLLAKIIASLLLCKVL